MFNNLLQIEGKPILLEVKKGEKKKRKPNLDRNLCFSPKVSLR